MTYPSRRATKARLSPEVPLSEARAWVRAHAGDKGGASCPCCERLVKRYSVPLNNSLAKALLRFYYVYCDPRREIPDRKREGIWLNGDVAILGKSGVDYSKLAWWGLVEPAEHWDTEGGGSGWWRLTGLGIQFAERRAQVQRRVVRLLGESEGLEGELIWIDEALASPHDHAQVMAAVAKLRPAEQAALPI